MRLSLLPACCCDGFLQATRAENRDPQSAIANPYHFQGARYDAETGFYYFRNRYYDPRAGRFLQRDPVWDEQNVGGQYTMVANGPTTRVDPMGLDDPRLLYAEELEIAKIQALSGNPEAVTRVHRLQRLLEGTSPSPAPPVDPVDHALKMIREDVVRYRIGGESQDAGPVEAGKIGLNCEQFIQKALRDAGLEENPVSVQSLVERWPLEKRRHLPPEYLEEAAMTAAGYFGKYGGYFEPAPDDYTPQRNDVLVYFLPSGEKHIAMFTGRGNEIVENTSASNASVNESPFGLSRRFTSGGWLYGHWKMYRYTGPPFQKGQPPVSKPEENAPSNCPVNVPGVLNWIYRMMYNR